MATAVQPLAQGCKENLDGSHWYNWWLFRRMGPQQTADVIEAMEVCAHYSGPGLPYSKQPSVRHSRSYTLIVQGGGYDI